jgi:transposase
MGQRGRILTEILDLPGWRARATRWETEDGKPALLLNGEVPVGVRLVILLERKWAPRCVCCGALRQIVHEQLEPRRWADLSWCSRPVLLEYAPVRIRCRRCDGRRVEFLSWAEPFQRQTQRLQHQLAVESASMPVMHVAALHKLSWGTVRRAEGAALARWAARREPVPLRHVGVDEKWLGRRHKLDYDFVTIVSNLETGEPLWIGPGRGEATLARWITTLSPAEKARIQLFAMDMHDPFVAAVRGEAALAHAAIAHDPFHVVKRAGQAVDELRRQVFFRAGRQRRGIGRGSRWLLLRAWERCTEAERERLEFILAFNAVLARAYQIKEELRHVLRAADRASMEIGLDRILRRTQARRHVPLRKLHETLHRRRERILALGEHRPATGRIEALNNNWETLVRRARGYRNYDYLLLKLRFATANPLRTRGGVDRFLALGRPGQQKAA